LKSSDTLCTFLYLFSKSVSACAPPVWLSVAAVEAVVWESATEELGLLADVGVAAGVLAAVEAAVVEGAVVGVPAGLPHPATAMTTRAASNAAIAAKKQNLLLRCANMFKPFPRCCGSKAPDANNRSTPPS